MLDVLGILALFVGLALLAAIPLVVVLQVADRRRSVNEVTPRDGP
ncbi:hypothetical protein [Actinocrispum wychmicini]|uniref:Uncharacterized protein n=1 Tax=Actinocrispum wychmicini TaxID=1213861 RepID=A0A4R2K476_9PSEU|nr:hypothetical protein [Actinocrispum wychmicini]TCO64588.1 hypothetical protein EV192_101365 [Actinocrispum wychmicini]